MTTWTTVQFRDTEDGSMEFQGPKIKNKSEELAKDIAEAWGYELSDKYTKPPCLIRIRIFFRNILVSYGIKNR